VPLLVDECWRQVKAIGAWGSGTAVLEAAGVAGAPGVVATDSGRDTLSAMQSLLAAQLVWERFPASVA
jgi:catalase